MTALFRYPRQRRPRWPKASPADWALGGLGFSMATASASFAGYMIVTAPAEVTGFGSKDFNVFVQWDRRSDPAAGGAPSHAPSDRAVSQVVADAAPRPSLSPPPVANAQIADVDITPTGSIPADVERSADPRSAAGTIPVGSAPLRDFRVRDVFGGQALIEHSSRFSLVQRGSILAGAGEVLAIERRGSTWIVRTAAGVIGGS